MGSMDVFFQRKGWSKQETIILHGLTYSSTLREESSQTNVILQYK